MATTGGYILKGVDASVMQGDVILELSNPSDPAVQIASDLHLEFYGKKTLEEQDDLFASIIQPKAPILALLGDIGIPTHPIYRRFLLQQAERFEAVLVLAGNHEFYDVDAPGPKQKPDDMTWSEFCAAQGSLKNSVQNMKAAIAAVCAEHPRLHFVDNTCVRIGEQADAPALLCTTLWSQIPEDAIDQVWASMNDYAMIYTASDNEIGAEGQTGKFKDRFRSPLCKLTPSHTSTWHDHAVQWLRGEVSRLANAGCDRIGVLTHHAPSMEGSSAPQHEVAGNMINHAFATDLRSVYEDAVVRYWAYGHTHFNNDRVTADTRLVSNQFGYAHEDVGVTYRPNFTITFNTDTGIGS